MVRRLNPCFADVDLWIDTIYTERYMDLPDKNPSGYLNASITDVLPFDGFNYLLAHGSGDDNGKLISKCRHRRLTFHQSTLLTRHICWTCLLKTKYGVINSACSPIGKLR